MHLHDVKGFMRLKSFFFMYVLRLFCTVYLECLKKRITLCLKSSNSANCHRENTRPTDDNQRFGAKEAGFVFSNLL